MTKQDIIKLIYSAFATDKLPEVEREFVNDLCWEQWQDWENVSPFYLEMSLAILFLMEPAQTKYHVPGYMICILSDKHIGDGTQAMSSLMQVLCADQNWDLYFSSYTADQRRAVTEFLSYIMENGSGDYVEMAKAALEDGWGK